MRAKLARADIGVGEPKLFAPVMKFAPNIKVFFARSLLLSTPPLSICPDKTTIQWFQTTTAGVDAIMRQFAAETEHLEALATQKAALLQTLTRQTALVRLYLCLRWTTLRPNPICISQLQARQAKLEEALAESAPAVEDALLQLRSLPKQHSVELRSMPNPPDQGKSSLFFFCFVFQLSLRFPFVLFLNHTSLSRSSPRFASRVRHYSWHHDDHGMA